MPRRPPAVARVLERLTATAREHDMFAPGDLVMVMVSGGPDSTCLLHSLHLLRRLLEIRLAVVHVDHGLRPDNTKDAAYVRRQAGRLRVPYVLRTAASSPAKGESVEAWARTIRYAAATDAAAEAGANRIATGHTLDDQAETVLIQLIRGGGPHAIAGIRPAGRRMVRPLIDVRRTEVEAFCRALGLRPRQDPTNADTRYLRNAIRSEVMPVLERSTGRDVKGPIARSARLLREHLDRFDPQPGGSVEAAVPADDLELRLDEFPDPGSRVRHIKEALRDRLGAQVTEDAILAVDDLYRGRPGRRRDLGGGLLAVRHKEYIRLSRTSPGARDRQPPS